MRRYLVERGAQFSKIQQAGRGTECHPMPGTVLVREWDEREYCVTVTADGLYELNGQRFKSLSATARHITGTQWSGPSSSGSQRAREANDEHCHPGLAQTLRGLLPGLQR